MLEMENGRQCQSIALHMILWFKCKKKKKVAWKFMSLLEKQMMKREGVVAILESFRELLPSLVTQMSIIASNFNRLITYENHIVSILEISYS